MKLISLKEFIQLFESSEKEKPWMVRVGNGSLVPLAEYKKRNKIGNLSALFSAIRNRNEYLERFYKKSLLVDVSDLTIQELPMPISHLDNNQLSQYKSIIRNIHFRDILQKTQSGIGNTSFLNVLLDLYTRNIIDYKILTPSGLFYVEKGRIGSVFSSYFFRASFMNPYFVYSLNTRLLHAKRVFTPTLGWTSYLYGFFESGAEEYVGTDVIYSVCKKTQQFADTFYPNLVSDIYCEPSEDLLHNKLFMRKYHGYFDTVFFSPPYYRLELYAGKNQSVVKYKTYLEWLDGYWRPTMELCRHVLAKGGKMCFVLSGYGSSSTEFFDLIRDMTQIASEFFKLKRTIQMYNKNVFVTSDKHRDTNEKILIFE